ncbi:MAG: cyclic nucleotide-binding domain-containing protein [Anaerolineales bacterium]
MTDSTTEQSTPERPPLIEVRNLVKVYQTPAGDVPVIKGLDVEVQPGEFVAIIGKSGSGKSTFINMLTGIDRPTSGEILIGGAPIHAYSEGQLAAWRGRQLGIVFQFFQLIPTLTVLENIILPMELNNLYTKAGRRERAMQLLKTVAMDAQADKLPAAISGGQQQRVAIARALANDPPLIVADEPTGNLDSATAEIIFGLFESLVAAGKTILMVTHDSDLARRVDRTILISNGEIVNEYLVRALSMLSQDQLAQMALRVAPQIYPPQASIIRQGETGDKFYVLLEGKAEVLLNAPGRGQIVVGQLRPGNYFGEMALLGNGLRAATVRAASDSQATVMALDNATFNELISDSRQLREELSHIVEQRATANQVQLLSALKQDDPAAQVQRPKRQTFAPGEVIIRSGELGKSFFIIEDGVVEVVARNSEDQEVIVNRLARGQYFGEMALLGDRRRTATVRASADGPARVVEYGAEEFERWAGSSARHRARVDEVAWRRKIALGQARQSKP